MASASGCKQRYHKRWRMTRIYGRCILLAVLCCGRNKAEAVSSQRMDFTTQRTDMWATGYPVFLIIPARTPKFMWKKYYLAQAQGIEVRRRSVPHIRRPLSPHTGEIWRESLETCT